MSRKVTPHQRRSKAFTEVYNCHIRSQEIKGSQRSLIWSNLVTRGHMRSKKSYMVTTGQRRSQAVKKSNMVTPGQRMSGAVRGGLTWSHLVRSGKGRSQKSNLVSPGQRRSQAFT